MNWEKDKSVVENTTKITSYNLDLAKKVRNYTTPVIPQNTTAKMLSGWQEMKAELDPYLQESEMISSGMMVTKLLENEKIQKATAAAIFHNGYHNVWAFIASQVGFSEVMELAQIAYELRKQGALGDSEEAFEFVPDVLDTLGIEAYFSEQHEGRPFSTVWKRFDLADKETHPNAKTMCLVHLQEDGNNFYMPGPFFLEIQEENNPVWTNKTHQEEAETGDYYLPIRPAPPERDPLTTESEEPGPAKGFKSYPGRYYSLH